jgi:hypothetical protein
VPDSGETSRSAQSKQDSTKISVGKVEKKRKTSQLKKEKKNNEEKNNKGKRKALYPQSDGMRAVYMFIETKSFSASASTKPF